MVKHIVLVLALAASTACGGGISPIGGTALTTGTGRPSVLYLNYESHQGNTVVAACALLATATITSISDGGSAWALRQAVDYEKVRTELWSTGAGAAVAAGAFKIGFSQETPASCAIQEYSGVTSLGATAGSKGRSGEWGVSLRTQDPGDYVACAIGANSYFGFTNPTGTVRRTPGVTANFPPGDDYLELELLDNQAAEPSTVGCSVVTSPAPFAAAALQLRAVAR